MKYSKNFVHQHAEGKSAWHIEWCTKYRYKIFKSDYSKNICLIVLEEAAKKAKEYVKNQKAHHAKDLPSPGILARAAARVSPAGLKACPEEDVKSKTTPRTKIQSAEPAVLAPTPLAHYLLTKFYPRSLKWGSHNNR